MKISRRKESSKEGQTNLSDFRSGQSEFLGQVKVYSSTLRSSHEDTEEDVPNMI